MFTLEVLTEEAEKLLQKWQDTGVDLNNFTITNQQGYTHISCMYSIFKYSVADFININKPIESFIRSSNSPFILESDELFQCVSAYTEDFKHLFINGSTSDYTPFVWPEQIVRYRAAMLLKTTG